MKTQENNVHYGKMVYKRIKKAQFKIQQMVFMLLALFIFFILIAMFFIVFQTNKMKKTASQLRQDQAVMLSNFLVNSPEFSCSSDLGYYCIDTDKVMMLKTRQIPDLWPVAYIKIRTVYPGQMQEIECNIENYPVLMIFPDKH